MAMYHWEADQEAFLVVSGEAVLIIEGEERPLRAWDFVHCPPSTKHVIIGAGRGPCVVIAVGARAHDGQPDSLGFTVDEVAKRHGASVEEDTMDGGVAYASVPRRKPAAYRDGWLPDSRRVGERSSRRKDVRRCRAGVTCRAIATVGAGASPVRGLRPSGVAIPCVWGQVFSSGYPGHRYLAFDELHPGRV